MSDTEEITHQEKQHTDMRLDDATVAAKIQRYPEAVQEPVAWLAAYVRERCSSRRDVLVDQVKKRGFKGSTFSENYFYRVLTGRYFQPDPGRPGKVLGSVQNLLQVIDALRANVLLHERAGKPPFVETSTWHMMRDFFDGKRAPESVCKFGVIIGPTGGQKTECAKHYCHLNNHGACVHLEAPERPSIATFLNDLTARYGNSTHVNSAQRKSDIANCVTDKKMIVVDNVQRLYVPGRGGDQPIFNYLQKLQDDSGCTIILMFAAIGSDFLTRGMEQGYFEQFEGRAGGRDQFLVMDDYAPREDVEAFASAYGLRGGETITYLEKLSRKPGRIRILCDSLQLAKRLADSRQERMTLSHVREVRGEVVAK
jgi:DNA transposition AAA+ family ATPase